jgi:4-hydroxy-tetrahydrodipicolinate synthase
MTHYAVHAALTTPFGDDGWVDLDALHLHLGLLMDDGVHGVMAAGTTGEGALLEESEVATVVASAVQAAEGRIEVIAHVGRASTPATTRLARAAAGSGADAIMAITPWFFRHDHEALLAHYRAVLASVEGTPVLAYNFPNRTGNDLLPELVDTLAGEGLAGLKDSTGSPERHTEYLDVAQGHDGFRLFVGSERLVGRSLEGKGAGSISALANVHAPLLLQLAEEGSDVAQAAVDRAQAQTPDIPSLKRAVAERLVEFGATYPVASRVALGG